MIRRRPRTAWVLALATAGCAAVREPLPEGAFIRDPLPPPQLPPPAEPGKLPDPPAPDPVKAREGAAAPLALGEVLASVQHFFPLLLAVEQEREVAAGQRLSAEGGFDPVVRGRGAERFGTFGNGVLDLGVEQASPFGGATTYAGWRLGDGNFPIYYGERKTADGGEFRAGVSVPLLQNRDIDPRRARLRAAQIQERLADPAVARARLDFLRSAAQAYWAWQTAGAQYRVADGLLRLAEERQVQFDRRAEAGAVSEFVAAQNRRAVFARRELRLSAERALQQAAVRLSLFVRDAAGNPVVPPSDWLLPDFAALEPPAPRPDQLARDVEGALARRPELERFRLEKERRANDLQLATNQLLPEVNTFAAAAQDVGFSKKTFTGTGPFATDRTFAEVGASLAVPLPFRAARGLTRTAQAQLAQLLFQERYARDEIAAQVQDAVSELAQTYRRVAAARGELGQAARVVELATRRFEADRTDLFELNLQEVALAEARGRVANALGLYFGAVANYRAVIGLDAAAGVPPGAGGCVLPATDPAVGPPPPGERGGPNPLPQPRPVP
ncbi:MAG: TolC family protein [Gemmataceae bacterium]|nr:TolC family protein [Gemmataceae bacterium]